MTILLFLITLINAHICEYDTQTELEDFLNPDTYYQKYCEADGGYSCPCDNCDYDFRNYPNRDVLNVTGVINTLYTEFYNNTFALNVTDEVIINKVVTNSLKIQYKLNNGASLTVHDIKVNSSYANRTTTIRCVGKCSVKNSVFTYGENESLSFITENDDKVNGTFTLENVVINLPAYSKDNYYTYVLDNVNLTFNGVTFSVTGENDTTSFVYLIYTRGKFSQKDLEGIDIVSDKDYNLTIICDGQWIIGAITGYDVSQIKCIDPTQANVDKTLEDVCFYVFLVIVILAAITLFTILCVFGVLILLPVIKRKLGKSSGSEYGILEGQ